MPLSSCMISSRPRQPCHAASSIIDPATTSGYVAAMLKAQAETFGAPLKNHLLYAYRPDFFKAARAMWSAMDADEVLGTPLVSLVNRRVASLNGCVF